MDWLELHLKEGNILRGDDKLEVIVQQIVKEIAITIHQPNLLIMRKQVASSIPLLTNRVLQKRQKIQPTNLLRLSLIS
jgi:hypothetical protein